MLFFKKRVKKLTRQDIIKSLKHETLKKIDELSKNDLDKFVKLVRNFFAKFFKLNYNFNSQQLGSAIDPKNFPKDTKDKIMNMIENVLIFQYGKEKPPQDTIMGLHTEFKKIIGLISEPTRASKAKEARKILFLIKDYVLRLKEKSFSFIKIFKNIKKPGFKPVIHVEKTKEIDISGDPSRIYDFISKAYKLIKEEKHEEAKKQYAVILKAYTTIPEQDKKKAYFHIEKLYKKITSSV